MIDIRKRSAELLKENFQIEERVTDLLFEKGWIRDDIAKKILLKEEYKQKVEPNGKQILKGKLAAKYHVSVELVEKILQK
ncbi:hypothetical protein D4R42_01390 [bacterium]|nr:MAG: hypothetical protein D4R42_01390 [bacterium]